MILSYIRAHPIRCTVGVLSIAAIWLAVAYLDPRYHAWIARISTLAVLISNEGFQKLGNVVKFLGRLIPESAYDPAEKPTAVASAKPKDLPMTFVTDLEALSTKALEAGAVAGAKAAAVETATVFEAGLPSILPAGYEAEVETIIKAIPASAIAGIAPALESLIAKAFASGTASTAPVA